MNANFHILAPVETARRPPIGRSPQLCKNVLDLDIFNTQMNFRTVKTQQYSCRKSTLPVLGFKPQSKTQLGLTS